MPRAYGELPPGAAQPEPGLMDWVPCALALMALALVARSQARRSPGGKRRFWSRALAIYRSLVPVCLTLAWEIASLVVDGAAYCTMGPEPEDRAGARKEPDAPRAGQGQRARRKARKQDRRSGKAVVVPVSRARPAPQGSASEDAVPSHAEGDDDQVVEEETVLEIPVSDPESDSTEDDEEKARGKFTEVATEDGEASDGDDAPVAAEPLAEPAHESASQELSCAAVVDEPDAEAEGPALAEEKVTEDESRVCEDQGMESPDAGAAPFWGCETDKKWSANLLLAHRELNIRLLMQGPPGLELPAGRKEARPPVHVWGSTLHKR